MKRRDLLTKEEFIPSRINQKFIRPANRIKYYNNKANELRHHVAYINKPLHCNLRIINQLMQGKSEAVFHKQFLIGKGVAIGIHTHIEEYDNKKHFALYQYILIPAENDLIKVINTKDND